MTEGQAALGAQTRTAVRCFEYASNSQAMRTIPLARLLRGASPRTRRSLFATIKTARVHLEGPGSVFAWFIAGVRSLEHSASMLWDQSRAAAQ